MKEDEKASPEECADILNENRVSEFNRLTRWCVLSARIWIRHDLEPEARREYDAQIESCGLECL